MSRYLKVAMEDGSELYIEAVDTDRKPEGHGHGHSHVPAMSTQRAEEKVVEATELFGKVLPAATGFAKGVAGQIRKDIPSDEMELEFSIALTGEVTAVICSGGAETGFKVKLKWKKAETGPESDAD